MRDSDGTAIFAIRQVLTGGSRRTAEFARQHSKPWIHLSAQADGDAAPKLLRDFVDKHRIKKLNVAGSRASKEPEVYNFVQATLTAAFGPKAVQD